MTFIRNFGKGKIVYRGDIKPPVFQFVSASGSVLAEAPSEPELIALVKKITVKNFKREKVYVFNRYGEKVITEGTVTSAVDSRVRVRTWRSLEVYHPPTERLLLHTAENYAKLKEIEILRKNMDELDSQIDSLIKKLVRYHSPKEEADGKTI
jgi:hypothetical protein